MRLEESVIDLDDNQEETVSTSQRNESRAMYAGVRNPDNYQTVSDELTISGSSDTLRELEGQAVDSSQQELRTSLDRVLVEAETPEDAEDYINGYMELASQDPEHVFKKDALNRLRTNTLTQVEAVLNRHRAIKATKNSVSTAITESEIGTNVAEFIGLALAPFSDQMAVAGLSVPEGMDAVDFLLSGEGKVALGEFIRNTDPETSVQVLGELDSAFKKIYEETGLVLTTGSVISDALDPEYKDSAWRWLDDAVTILDATIIGKVLSVPIKAIKFGKVVTTSERTLDKDSPEVGDVTDQVLPMNETASVSPEFSQSLLQGALESDDAARVLSGAERNELYMSKEMPKYNDDGVPLEYDSMPSAIAQEQQHLANLQREILDSAHLSGIQLTEAEQLAQMEGIRERLADMRTISLKESHTAITKGEEGFDVGAVYSKTPTHGWERPEDAVLDTVEALRSFGVDSNDIVVLTKTEDGKSQALTLEESVAYTQQYPGKVEFETVVTFNKFWDNQGIKTFSEKQAKSIFSGLGKLTGYIINPVNRYDKSITAVTNLMKDRGAGISDRLTDMLKPVADLNANSKKKVVNLLREGDTASHRYSPAELNTLVKTGELTEDEMGAVLANYKFWDTVFLIDNRTYARSLSDKGYSIAKGDSITGEAFAFIGKQTDIDSVKNKPVLNLHTDSTLLETDEVYSYMKLKDTVKGSDGTVYQYAAVLNTPTNSMRAVRSTDKVLSYREGYYPRRYRGEYFVDRIVRDADGKIIETRTVANLESMTQAQSYAGKQLDKESSGKVEFVARESEELKSDLDLFGTDTAESLFQDVERGRSIQKYRGEVLSTFDDRGSLEVARTLDPIETMMSSAFNTGRVALHYDGLSALENRWTKTFGHLSGGKFPASINAIGKEKVGLKDVEKAKAIFEYIQHQRNVADSNLIAGMTKKLMYAVGDLLDAKEAKRLGDIFRAGGKIDPVHLVRSAAFLEFIVGNPVRQAVLQTFQLTQVMTLTGKYLNPKRLIQDTSTLKRLALAGADKATYAKTLEKVDKSGSGLSKEDWTVIADNFKKSGLPSSIDSHQLVEGLTRSIGGEIYHSDVATRASAALDTAKAPFRFMKRVGFDFGELNNLSGTWMVAIERYGKQHGKVPAKFTARDWAKVADDSRSLSWNMNRADMFEYQRGLLSAPLQFVQVFHKAFLYYALGNRTLTRAERLKIIAANGAVFTGIFTSVYNQVDDELAEAPELVKETFRNGVFNYTLNSVLSAAESGLTGEDVDVNVDFTGLNPATGLLDSSALAAMSIFELQPPGWSDMPGMVALDRFSENFSRAWRIASGDFGFDISTPERIAKASLTMASTLSGVNNTTRAFVGASMERQSMVNAKFQPIVEASLSELGFYGLVGLQPEAVGDVYELGEKVYGNKKFTQDAIKELGETLYKDLEMFTLGQSDENRLIGMQFILQNLDTENREAVINSFLKLDRDRHEDYQQRFLYKILKNSTNITDDGLEAAKDYSRQHGLENYQVAFDNIINYKVGE